MLDEVVEALDIDGRNVIVDATYGRGGHAVEVLKRLSQSGRLIVIDRDLDAVNHALTELAGNGRVEIVHAPFSELERILDDYELMGKVDAILFDLGVSSPQLDQGHRGFSFTRDGPLDMRMDTSTGISAAHWLEQVEEQELVRVLKIYGEERFARRIASRIKQAVADSQINSTADLAELVSDVVPTREIGKHPATRTFQAIRIAVNDELGEIETVLPQALNCLAVGGRLVIISFHSLEDRLVKHFMRDQSKGDHFPPDLPVTSDQLNPRLKLVGKPMRANQDELDRNPRARSAVLRVAEKVA